jgi:hypothetical protein
LHVAPAGQSSTQLDVAQVSEHVAPAPQTSLQVLVAHVKSQTEAALHVSDVVDDVAVTLQLCSEPHSVSQVAFVQPTLHVSFAHDVVQGPVTQLCAQLPQLVFASSSTGPASSTAAPTVQS